MWDIWVALIPQTAILRHYSWLAERSVATRKRYSAEERIRIVLHCGDSLSAPGKVN